MSFRLDRDENIIFEAKRSWFVLWIRILFWIFSLLIPIAFFSIMNSIGVINFGPKENYFFIIIILIWIFIAWNFIFIAMTNHFLDILIITNKNIIDIEQRGLFSREISVISLSEIQDITTVVNGITESLIDYGTLIIQSAGSRREFVVKDLHKPSLVRSKIKQAISGELPLDKE